MTPISRRRTLQMLLAAGAAGVMYDLTADRVHGADGPQWPGGRRDEFELATDSPVASNDLSITTTATSIDRGSDIEVSAASAFDRLDVALFRLGWRDDQAAQCVAVLFDLRATETMSRLTSFGTSEMSSGLYVVVAVPSGRSAPMRAHPFVVRDRSDTAPIVMQIPTMTYQAYNGWGGASLYRFNSPGGAAAEVDLGRPYDTFDGSGFLYHGDWQLATWLERNGYDVTYATSLDTHGDPDLMTGRRLFLSGFHDEYWTRQMRRHLEGWVAQGVNATFFTANSVYLQVELETSATATVMHCDKVAAGPQGTFRTVGEPEHLLLGSSYESYEFPYGVAAADWVVTNADHWTYRGTGLRNGDTIERLVGYEWDRLPGDTAAANVTVLADSPIGDRFRHHACFVDHGAGAVFNAGTTYWPRLLLGGGHWAANANVDRMTRNLLDELGAP